jgi:hypothetical protein
VLLLPPLLSRVVILADETANWRVAGLRQLDRLVLSIQELARDQRRPVSVSIWWNPETAQQDRWLPNDARLTDIEISESSDNASPAVVLSTRWCPFRFGLKQLLEHSLAPAHSPDAEWNNEQQAFFSSIASAAGEQPWRLLNAQQDTARITRALLRHSGKTQDGLVSRYVNRPVSRAISYWLLKTPITPSTWSILIFVLPLLAAFAFLQGTYLGFVIGCAVFQLFSILDGCDGEIARAKFLHTEFGRKLDSCCDLVGNMLLALCLGFGLAQQAHGSQALGWIYIVEGIAAAALICASEGIVFLRRTRSSDFPPTSARFKNVLYQRHHEFLQRSGILLLGENVAWFLVVFTKRDMAMLAFLVLALLGHTEWALHLLLFVSAVSSALAGNAFFRAPAAAVPQEAS